MESFLPNFLATPAADAVLAIAVLFILTRPGEKRTREEKRRTTLGLLRSEAQINNERAATYIDSLADSAASGTPMFPCASYEVPGTLSAIAASCRISTTPN